MLMAGPSKIDGTAIRERFIDEQCESATNRTVSRRTLIHSLADKIVLGRWTNEYGGSF
jgi:hypothetical protein